MSKYKASKSLRFFFTVAAVVIWSGIALTGFGTVHWLLFVPAGFFAFAAITGFCPGLIFSRMLFGDD